PRCPAYRCGRGERGTDGGDVDTVGDASGIEHVGQTLHADRGVVSLPDVVDALELEVVVLENPDLADSGGSSECPRAGQGQDQATRKQADTGNGVATLRQRLVDRPKKVLVKPGPIQPS